MKKKLISCFLAIFFIVNLSNAQLDKETIKLLNYEKYIEVIASLEKKISINPKDAQSIFWLGEAYIEQNNEIRPLKEDVEKAKILYQKYLQDLGSDPWLLVGMANIEILQGGDINSAKQKMEQAITATIQTKGKNKGKPSLEILFAIGRIHSEMNIVVGDHNYAIEKLKLALTIVPIEPEVYVELGINYLKLGAENGGDAVVAFKDAINLDPKNAKAYFRIAKIYASQDNKEKVDECCADAIKADPNFAPMYLGLFEFYEDKDINIAKVNLDKYISLAEKNPKILFIEAQYLFRTGKYNESIEVAKKIESQTGIEKLPKLSLLLALDYERVNDTTQSLYYIETYFKITPKEKLNPIAFDLAINVYSRFSDKIQLALQYIDEQIKTEKTNQHKLEYFTKAIKLLDKAGLYKDEYNWLMKFFQIKANLNERDYYDATKLAITAQLKNEAMEWSNKYITSFPASKQALVFYTNSAIALDPDTSTGIAIPYLENLNTLLINQSRENRGRVLKNITYFISYNLKKGNLEKVNFSKIETTPDQQDSIKIIINKYNDKIIEYTNIIEQLYQDKQDELPKILDWTTSVKKEISNSKEALNKAQEAKVKYLNSKNKSSKNPTENPKSE